MSTQKNTGATTPQPTSEQAAKENTPKQTDATAAPPPAGDTKTIDTPKTGENQSEAGASATAIPPDGSGSVTGVDTAKPGTESRSVATEGDKPQKQFDAHGREVSDHMTLQQSRASAEDARDRRQRQRQKSLSQAKGNMPGEWALIGTKLFRLDALASVDAPREGDPNPSLTLTLITGQSVTVIGPELEDVMHELGLRFLPAVEKSEIADVQEDGRLLSRADQDAKQQNPNRIQTVPVGPRPDPLPSPPKRSASHGPTAPASNSKPKETPATAAQGEKGKDGK